LRKNHRRAPDRSKTVYPAFYLRRDIELDALLKFGGELNKTTFESRE